MPMLCVKPNARSLSYTLSMWCKPFTQFYTQHGLILSDNRGRRYRPDLFSPDFFNGCARVCCVCFDFSNPFFSTCVYKPPDVCSKATEKRGLWTPSILHRPKANDNLLPVRSWILWATTASWNQLSLKPSNRTLQSPLSSTLDDSGSWPLLLGLGRSGSLCCLCKISFHFMKSFLIRRLKI